MKIEFSFGAHGLDVKADEVIGVTSGTQAASKGVKKGWKVVMIDGKPMDDDAAIRPTIQKKSKAGKKYTIVFSYETNFAAMQFTMSTFVTRRIEVLVGLL